MLNLFLSGKLSYTEITLFLSVLKRNPSLQAALRSDEKALNIGRKERDLIIKALHKSRYVKKIAAKKLGISTRQLGKKIKRHKIIC